MGGPRNYEQTYRDLLQEAGEREMDPKDSLYPVIERASGRVIGDCGLIRKEGDGSAETELIYVIAKKAWGLG